MTAQDLAEAIGPHKLQTVNIPTVTLRIPENGRNITATFSQFQARIPRMTHKINSRTVFFAFPE